MSVSCIRRRSQLLASHSGKCGKPFVSCQAQVPGNQKQAVAWSALLSDFPLLFLTRFCFALSRLSFSLFNLSRFDEPTSLAVTMTESRTSWAVAPNADPQMSQHAPRPGSTQTSPNSDRAGGDALGEITLNNLSEKSYLLAHLSPKWRKTHGLCNETGTICPCPQPAMSLAFRE